MDHKICFRYRIIYRVGMINWKYYIQWSYRVIIGMLYLLNMFIIKESEIYLQIKKTKVRKYLIKNKLKKEKNVRLSSCDVSFERRTFIYYIFLK